MMVRSNPGMTIFTPASMESKEITTRCEVCKGPLETPRVIQRGLCWVCFRLKKSAEQGAE